ncbi:undecaprenyl-diphosphate phosphatase [Zongyangia hominis]|uniref:Undecaprenyl-diphosphatase n=1 Tax=Zongyangia hominis TaxID=2763677 RepID=A0A926ICC1_9FIRM|nr:undecaprenyl-diphosphate phosphatase [Zongyangia hominis]MBC8570960.1 undecaprenyl-diphosphate phosphatase [Zongyangia hominis]
MSILNAIFQAIVQGLTEFLPVSSSGHLSLVQHFTGVSGETGIFFSIMLHLGTLIAVFVAFWPTIKRLIVEFFLMIGDIFRGRFRLKEANPYRRMILLLIVSLVPLIPFYFLSDFYKGLASDKSILAEGICFLITAALLFIADRRMDGRKTAKNMRFADAVAIGIAQGIAPLPGVSRSGSTISVGLMCGLKKEYAVKFSFIMGIPAVLAANLVELKDAMEVGTQGVGAAALIVGVLVSAVVGFLAIKMVQWLLKENKFKIFAYYTLILGILVITIAIIELLMGQNIAAFFGWIK